ncbi:unnamed protein product [Lymnaea stagnalis]|uniref:Ubiquitin-like domain-containing protein n=1 Tax=Lymnaea stagnalis TaxID=6523 RepID=A0AAV2HQ12_LYMST
MSLIEGIGDEVTLILCLFFLGIVLMLAWISTHTADIPLLREVGVIVVELSQRRSRTRNNDASSNVDGARNTDSSERTSSLTEQQTEEHLENDTIALTNSREENTNIESAKVNSQDGNTAETSFENSSIQTEASDVPPVTDFQLNVPRIQESESFSQVLGRQIQRSDELSNQEEAESLFPNASVVVGENSGSFHVLNDELSTEEELRRRRVQYFQSSHLNSLPEETHVSKPLSGDSAVTSSLQKAEHINKNNPKSQSRDNLISSNLTDSVNHNVSASEQSIHDEDHSQPQSPDVTTRQAQEDNTSISRIRVKLKYMNETQRLVYASPLDTIGDFRRTNFQAELQDNKWVRFIYNGQDLRDDARTLQACNISDNCTMHCLITSPTRTATSRDSGHEDEDDSFMGALMYPLFTVILLIVWYCRFTYRQYFSAMSTVCLIGITFLLALSYVSSLRVSEQPPRQSMSPAVGSRAQHTHEHAE